MPFFTTLSFMPWKQSFCSFTKVLLKILENLGFSFCSSFGRQLQTLHTLASFVVLVFVYICHQSGIFFRTLSQGVKVKTALMFYKKIVPWNFRSFFPDKWDKTGQNNIFGANFNKIAKYSTNYSQFLAKNGFGAFKENCSS